VTAETASILSTIGGVLAGGIAAFLGNSTSSNHDTTSRVTSKDTTTDPGPDTPTG
jgi:hypothetical protein